MKRKVRVLPAARQDAFEAEEWYARESLELAIRFATEFTESLRHIADRPTWFPIVWRDVRRARLASFPYGVFFYEHDRQRIVFAVVHLHRHQREWRQRR